jgi:uncharacterized membrane protein YfcA
MLISLILGTALGFLSGLGIGGGSLLILWLTLVMELDPQTARTVNLLFFLPSALTAAYFRWHQGTVHLKKLLPAILGGCTAALVFSLLSSGLVTGLLKKLFGLLLIVTGLRELFYKPKTKREGQ